MWAKLKSARKNLKPLITGWLVMALLLPALLGTLPTAQAASTAEILQSIDLQLCSQLGHNDDGKGQHDHDCPCCMPSGTAQLATPAINGPIVALPETHFVRAIFVTWSIPSAQPHDISPARQRGPPTSLSA